MPTAGHGRNLPARDKRETDAGRRVGVVLGKVPGHLTRQKTTHLTRYKTPRLADAPGSFLWYTKGDE